MTAFPFTPKKTLLVDDHPLFLDGLVSVLDTCDELLLLPPITLANEALHYVLHHEVDFLITDVNLPDMSGIDLVRKIKQVKPEVLILVVSMYCDRKNVGQILHAEVEGYLLKVAGKHEFYKAIGKIINGGTYYSNEIVTIMMEIINKKESGIEKSSTLTSREREILHLICKEFSNKEISEKLFISISTIETHRGNMFQKTNSKNVVGLVRYAVENDLVTW